MSFLIYYSHELETCAMHGYVFKNDRNEKIIIIISGCIKDKKKKKTENVTVSWGKQFALGVRPEHK